MKTYYYNFDQGQSQHFASLRTGDKMVIVVPLKEQPPEGWKIQGVYDEDVRFYDNGQVDIQLPYPLNARVGLRETWDAKEGYLTRYKAHKDDPIDRWHSSQCMPRKVIRYWPPVIDVRVSQVQNIKPYEINRIMPWLNTLDCDLLQSGFEDWFNRRHKGKWTWEQNPYCEIGTLRKER